MHRRRRARRGAPGSRADGRFAASENAAPVAVISMREMPLAAVTATATRGLAKAPSTIEFDGVLDERLQHHRRHSRVELGIRDGDGEREALAVAHAHQVEPRPHERDLGAQRRRASSIVGRAARRYAIRSSIMRSPRAASAS